MPTFLNPDYFFIPFSIVFIEMASWSVYNVLNNNRIEYLQLNLILQLQFLVFKFCNLRKKKNVQVSKKWNALCAGDNVKKRQQTMRTFIIWLKFLWSVFRKISFEIWYGLFFIYCWALDCVLLSFLDVTLDIISTKIASSEPSMVTSQQMHAYQVNF